MLPLQFAESWQRGLMATALFLCRSRHIMSQNIETRSFQSYLFMCLQWLPIPGNDNHCTCKGLVQAY